MKKITKFFCLITGLLSVVSVYAILPVKSEIAQSQQLIVVTTKDWNTPSATLQTFSRINLQKSWRPVGATFNVVIGKNGVAWGRPFAKLAANGPIKKEGDNRSPAGVFSIGDAFGFAKTQPGDFKLDYIPITANTVCVDDKNSKYYNQIIDAAQVTKKDWNSGEQMKTVPGYYWGAVINYNTSHPVPGSGSCIFMHIWKGPNVGTAGCVAMQEDYLEQVLAWLNPAKNPLVIILPEAEYKNLQSAWGLPPLPNSHNRG